jgi:hypothetical protein
MIAGVSDAAALRTRGAQPFLAGEDAERVLTWVLRELNNADKHRLIPVMIDHTSVIPIGHPRSKARHGRLRFGGIQQTDSSSERA